jgi:hypothetical protein
VTHSSSAWSGTPSSQELCARCGVSLDSRHFDESSIGAAPRIGETIVLARFELPLQYCGLLEYFSQYTNLLAVNPGNVETQGMEWAILTNGHPLAPYLPVDRILNPWGYTNYPIGVRLEESSTIELVVRNRNSPLGAIARVGGRIAGRYWYDVSEGEAARGRR